MKSFVLLIFFPISFAGYSQKSIFPTQHVSLNFGYSTHFSGDLPGLIFATQYSRNFKPKLSYNISLSGTIHDKEDTLYLRPYSGALINSSIRGTTAGVQIACHVGYDILRTFSHNLKIKFGPLLRYQSSSNSGYTILYPALTGFPTPLLYLENYEPQKVFTVGGSLQLGYDVGLSQKITVGLLGGFQTDSNGDNIIQLSLSIGRRF